MALSTRFDRLGTLKDLEETITYRRQALSLHPCGHSNHTTSLNSLANALSTRFEHLDNMEDLEEAITYYHQALALCPPGHTDHTTSLSDLAIALTTRFERLGKMEDLEGAIRYHRQALVSRPPHHPGHSAILGDLAIALGTRFNRLGTLEDLRDAIMYHRQALDLLPPGHPERPASLNSLAITLNTRFDQLGNMEDLEEAITFCREAVVLRPPGHPNRPASLGTLANFLRARFRQLGGMNDLEEAITYSRQILVFYPPGHPDRAASLSILANTLQARFDKLGEMVDLEDGIMYDRQALVLCPPGHAHRSALLNNLANGLKRRFDEVGKVEDLEEAIIYNYQALELRPPGHPGHPRSLNNLASQLIARFEQLGKMEDLEDAITYHRQALALCPPGHIDRPSSLNNLANDLKKHFYQLGKVEDLEEAITYYRQALTLHSPGHHHHSDHINNLADALTLHFHWLGKREDLDEAIKYYHEVILHTPDHPHHSGYLNNLANALIDRFHQQGKLEDLEDAIGYCHQGLALCPPGHPDHPSYLKNLAQILSTRFDKLHKAEDLKEAINHLFEADLTLPSEHPLHVTIRNQLASTLLKQYDISLIPDHLAKAFTLFESTANYTAASSLVRFSMALNWATQAQQRQHESTIHAYSKIFSLLMCCLIANPTMESQQKFIATHVPKLLASDAASSAIKFGQIETAVELLEQGRAMLWSRMQGYRHSLEQLYQVNKQLADQFQTLSTQLEHHAMSSDSESLMSPRSFETKMRTHRILSEKWEQVLEKIQQIDGFTDFLRAVPFTTLQTAAAEGPVIMVNISRYHSDAIIICATSPPVLVPLPQTLPQDLALLSSQMTDILRSDPFDSSKKVLPVLRSLWELIVYPVVNQLALLGVAEMSRIWWCPTSELCTLPLHAAGPYMHRQKNLPDIYISSYTPTLSSLIRARSGVVHGPNIPSLLVIGQPGKDIPMVEEELCQIQQFGRLVNVLTGEGSNHTTVISGLQQHSWAHFACHGHQHIDPLQSSFQLHNNNNITILDLIKTQLPNAEFAFLSACHSAAGDRFGTPDEVIHLAAALQFTGFRSVVGTLWAMADVDGPEIVKDFYTHMFRQEGNLADFRDSAMALNLATRQMRKRPGMTIDRWINFVHIGA